MLRGGAVTLVIAISSIAFGQPHSCTAELSKRADAALDHLTSWDSIYEWYRDYRQCDDGGPAEGVSEAVARNLVDRWQTLPRLGELAKNAEFRRFVIKHLDETVTANDLRKISANASKHCPSISLQSLCAELKKQAEAP
jgi:hypothetical protein